VQVRTYLGRARHKADTAQTAYGSEGWGFESPRARSVLRRNSQFRAPVRFVQAGTLALSGVFATSGSPRDLEN
jgi:hypothetical protein